LTAYCTEARPRYLGRKAAREMAQVDGLETHLMVDGAAGIHLSEVDRVVLGMTCIVNERYYNRVGTFPIVAAARHENVPVTVVGSGAKIIEDGFQFENEYRSPVEVLLEPAEGFEIENPAYDETPVDLIDRVITDMGVRTY
jgi:translation initiation factor eIF-2B subunit delta